MTNGAELEELTGPELPKLPDGWTYYELSKLLEQNGLSYGIVQPGSDDPGGIPIIRVKDLHDNKINTQDVLRVSSNIEEKYQRTRLEGGEILLSLVGSVGEVAVAPYSLAGWNVARAIAVIRVPDTLRSWVRYYLISELAQRFIRIWQTTTVQATLNLRDVRRIPIAIPPKEEGGATVSVLQALDDKIAANDQIVVTGEELVVTIAGDGICTPRVPLEEIVRHIRDQVPPTNFDSQIVAHYSLPAFDRGRLPELVVSNSIMSGKFVVDAPAVLLSKLNPSIPRVWSVRPSSDIPALASTEFLVLKPIDGISPDEIWAVCSQSHFTSALIGKVTGTSNSHQRVKPVDLLTTSVVDPRSIPGKKREAIRSISQRIRQARSESQTLAGVRDAILPKLMSGAIRVRDAEKVAEEAT